MPLNWIESSAFGGPMDLALAIASGCTDAGCQVAFLDEDAPIDASYAELMLAHEIRVEPGHLVAVDRGTIPPRVVYRWEDVLAMRGDDGYALTRDGRPFGADALRVEFYPQIQSLYQGDVSPFSFNTLLLLESVQLSWFPGWVPEPELAVALRANPAVEWYLRHKCPELEGWLDQVMGMVDEDQPVNPAEARKAEVAVLGEIEDLVVYAVDPAIYDAQPFLGWDSQELISLVDLTGKTVIDVGSGTGRLALIAAERAAVVYAVEPVANLRRYLKDKARAQGVGNVYVVDGLITDLPFPDGFADVTMEGHVFGDHPEEEHREMVRVTRAGGLVIHCPGGTERDEDRHRFLVSQGYAWARYEEPGSGTVRKYWKTI
jgi:hypothetical protein